MNTEEHSKQWAQKRLFFFPKRAYCLFFLILLLFAGQVQAAEGKVNESAIFPPFNIQVTGNYDYLRDGLTSVLASRIATRTGVKEVHGTAVAEKIAAYLKAGQQEKAFKALRNSNADYLILGSLTEENGKFLLTVEVISRKKGAALKQFSRGLNSIEDALPVIDELGWDVSADVFGVDRPQKIGSGNVKKDGMSSFQTAHPDRAYKEGMYAGIIPGFDTGDLSLLDTKRSPKIPYGVNDMDGGDLDGDGNVELVMAGIRRLYIYRFTDGHFKKVDTIDLDGYLRIHAISLADLDGNGLQEIYVSANKEKKPVSTVIEWDGHQSRFLRQHVPYYLHIATPDGKPVLLGQVAGTAGSNPFIGNAVYRLKPGKNADYIRGEKLALPQGLTIFDIAFADLDGSGKQKMIAVTQANTLQVYDADGKLVWTDPGQFGGSSNYLGTMATAARSNIRIYVPPRIVVHDVNGDGIADIVLCKNRMKKIKYFKRYRYFEGSSIAALSWQKDRLVPLWETKKLPEYTVACQVVAPLQTDKRHESTTNFRLFFAQGQNNYSFGFWQTRSTSLFMYEIGLTKP